MCLATLWGSTPYLETRTKRAELDRSEQAALRPQPQTAAGALQVQRKTKIICTAVPSTTKATLASLIAAGMDVLRLNLSHSSTADADTVLAEYRTACDEAGRLPCVLCELRGSTLRASYLVDRASGAPVKAVELRAGTRAVLYGSASGDAAEFVGWADGDGARIGIQYERLGEITPVGTVVRCWL